MARIELLDALQMEACIRYSKLDGFTASPTLLFEFHGSEAGVREQAEAMEAIAGEHAGSAFQWATRPETGRACGRRVTTRITRRSRCRRNARRSSTDACVPISRLADCLLETRAELDREGVIAPIVGHVGDGNFHVLVLFDPASAAERAKADDIARRVSMRAIAMGGTCTGEHGVGFHKLDALVAEHGEAVDLMKTLKRAFDPYDIMNPGKTVPQ